MESILQHLREELQCIESAIKHYQQLQDALTTYDLTKTNIALTKLSELLPRIAQLEEDRISLFMNTLQISYEKAAKLHLSELFCYCTHPRDQQQLASLQKRFRNAIDTIERLMIINHFLVRRALHFTETMISLLFGGQRSIYNVKA